MTTPFDENLSTGIGTVAVGPMKYLVTRAIRTSLFVVLFSGIGTSAMRRALPMGFVDELVVGGLDLPTAFTALPDGRLLVAEKAGRVRVISSSGQSAGDALHRPAQLGERLLGPWHARDRRRFEFRDQRLRLPALHV